MSGLSAGQMMWQTKMLVDKAAEPKKNNAQDGNTIVTKPIAKSHVSPPPPPSSPQPIPFLLPYHDRKGGRNLDRHFHGDVGEETWVERRRLMGHHLGLHRRTEAVVASLAKVLLKR